MSDTESIKNVYGDFFSETSTVEFDSRDVPGNLHHLISYARFWGHSDDWAREQLIEKAPARIKISLKKLISDNDDALDDWLAGNEASNPDPTDAYIAFSAMRMAADTCD